MVGVRPEQAGVLKYLEKSTLEGFCLVRRSRCLGLVIRCPSCSRAKARSLVVATKFLGVCSAIASTSRIVFITVLITNLATRSTSSTERVRSCFKSCEACYIPILAAFTESFVQICADHTFIQLRPSNVLHAIQRVLVSVVFDEAETTWRLLEAI